MCITLSRQSQLYAYTFGGNEGELPRFPEPQSNTVPLGLYLTLAALQTFLLLWFRVWISALSAALFLLVFLLNGSVAGGNLLSSVTETPIEPWPRVYGRRIPPWTVLLACAVPSYFVFNELATAVEYTFWTLLFVSISWFHLQSDSPSASNEIAEELSKAATPAMNDWLQGLYRKRATLLPTIHLVD